jgi:hypothetical protein
VRAATLTIGALLLGLAAVVAAGAVFNLATHKGPESGVSGIIVAAASLCFMGFLWAAKVWCAAALDSAVLLADAACSLSCIQISVVLLLGSLLTVAVPGGGAWWVDSAAALCIAGLVAREGRAVGLSALSDDFDGAACDCHAEAAGKARGNGAGGHGHGLSRHDNDRDSGRGSGGWCGSWPCTVDLNGWLLAKAKASLLTPSGALRLPPSPDFPHAGGCFTESGDPLVGACSAGFPVVDLDALQAREEEAQAIAAVAAEAAAQRAARAAAGLPPDDDEAEDKEGVAGAAEQPGG